jgi:hypothetical protein
VFFYDKEQEDLIEEKEWPLGPTSAIGSVWPFVFLSTDGNYDAFPNMHSDRYFVCGVVAVYTTERRRPLIELPEVTAAYGVLEEISHFLPPNLSSSTASTFQFHLKSAMPFGSPVRTSLDDLNLLNSTSMTQNDLVVLSNWASMSTQRIPAWKPFPIAATSGLHSASLKLHVSEKVRFEIISGDQVNTCCVSGSIICDCDIPGVPEVTMPIQFHHGSGSLSVHACAKLLSESDKESIKVSFIPLSSTFSVCDFNYPTLRFPKGGFPIVASFRLFQISPTQFRFNLSVRLKILFTHFHVTFRVSKCTRIVATPHTSHSQKTRFEIVNGSVMWTFKAPTTFNPNGEQIDGIIETNAPPSGTELGRHASMHFRMTDNYFSKLRVMRENVSIFPNTAKTNIIVSYEMMSAGGCIILNEALACNTSLEQAIDFTDSIEIVSAQ